MTFDIAFWRKLWALHHTSLKMSPAYRPQADGQTERANRVLQEIIRCNIQADQLNWLELLDGAVAAINNSKSSSTGLSPFEIEHGLPMRLPIDLVDLSWCRELAHTSRVLGLDPVAAGGDGENSRTVALPPSSPPASPAAAPSPWPRPRIG